MMMTMNMVRAWVVAGIVISLSAFPLLGAGDISVHIVDMSGMSIAGSKGGAATLRGLDTKGFRNIGPRLADSSGVVLFNSQEIQAQMQFPFRFTVETVGSNAALRANLYDPFGYGGSFIEYQSFRSYVFEIPTPVIGQLKPEIAWNGAASQLKFIVDLGARSAADFWILRAVWQKNAPSEQFAGPQFGLIPVLSGKWLSSHGYVLDDKGFSGGGVGNLRIQSTSYDQTFLARKQLSASADDELYEVFLVNCLWEKDLLGFYDSSQKTCVFTFNPESLFTDTNAPAWDGVALKNTTPYFVTLQAQTWQWNEAGAAGGLAIDWGMGAAASVFDPVSYGSPPVTKPIQLGVSYQKGGSVTLSVSGGNSARAYTVDYTDRLIVPLTWSTLMTTQFSTSILILKDPTPLANARFYRVRQP